MDPRYCPIDVICHFLDCVNVGLLDDEHAIAAAMIDRYLRNDKDSNRQCPNNDNWKVSTNTFTDSGAIDPRHHDTVALNYFIKEFVASHDARHYPTKVFKSHLTFYLFF